MSTSTITVSGGRGLLLAVALLLTLPGCSDERPASSRRDNASAPTAGTTSPPAPGEPGSTTPGPDAAPVAAPAEVVEATGLGVEEYVVGVSRALTDPSADPTADGVVEAVTGAALEELRNRAVEYEAAGWRVVGEPEVVRHRVVEYYDDPELAVVRACVDNSAVRVEDADGRVVPGSTPPRPRSLNVLRLVRTEGRWVVAEQRLAARPDC